MTSTQEMADKFAEVCAELVTEHGEEYATQEAARIVMTAYKRGRADAMNKVAEAIRAAAEILETGLK